MDMGGNRAINGALRSSTAGHVLPGHVGPVSVGIVSRPAIRTRVATGFTAWHRFRRRISPRRRSGQGVKSFSHIPPLA